MDMRGCGLLGGHPPRGWSTLSVSSLGVQLKLGARHRTGRSQGVRDLEWLEEFTKGG